MERIVVAVDPGKEKCGVAVLQQDGEVLLKHVISTEELCKDIIRVFETYEVKLCLMGNGTTSKQASKMLQESIPSLNIQFVDEYRTTELARKRYYKENPPKGWRAFLPVGLQTPPVPVDDYVAVILARRYFGLEMENQI